MPNLEQIRKRINEVVPEVTKICGWVDTWNVGKVKRTSNKDVYLSRYASGRSDVSLKADGRTLLSFNASEFKEAVNGCLEAGFPATKLAEKVNNLEAVLRLDPLSGLWIVTEALKTTGKQIRLRVPLSALDDICAGLFETESEGQDTQEVQELRRKVKFQTYLYVDQVEALQTHAAGRSAGAFFRELVDAWLATAASPPAAAPPAGPAPSEPPGGHVPQ